VVERRFDEAHHRALGGFEPFLYLSGHLDGQFGSGAFVPARGRFEEIEGLVDELALQLLDERLGVGVADVVVAVVEDKDFVDLHNRISLASMHPTDQWIFSLNVGTGSPDSPVRFPSEKGFHPYLTDTAPADAMIIVSP